MKEYNELLQTISDDRDKLDEMLTTIESLRKNTTAILPQTTDYRNKHLMEEKMKTISSVFATELNIRQQKEKSIITEIEVRRKIEREDKGINDEDPETVNAVMKILEKKNKETTTSSVVKFNADHIDRTDIKMTSLRP